MCFGLFRKRLIDLFFNFRICFEGTQGEYLGLRYLFEKYFGIEFSKAKVQLFWKAYFSIHLF